MAENESLAFFLQPASSVKSSRFYQTCLNSMSKYLPCYEKVSGYSKLQTSLCDTSFFGSYTTNWNVKLEQVHWTE